MCSVYGNVAVTTNIFWTLLYDMVLWDMWLDHNIMLDIMFVYCKSMFESNHVELKCFELNGHDKLFGRATEIIFF